MIKTLFFDMGNVLVFFSYEKMISQVSTLTGISPTSIQQFLLQDGHLLRYETGSLTDLDLYQKAKKIAPNTFSLEAFQEALSAIFTPNIPLFPILEHLKREHIRLILLSNTSHAHLTYLEKHFSFLPYFDDRVLSFKVGFAKPDPRIYEYALQIAGAEPHECFYFDDIPEYIEAAQKAHLPGALFTDHHSCIATLKNLGLLAKKDFP